MVDQRGGYAVLPAGPLSEVINIANFWCDGNKIWTCTESEFRLCWITLWLHHGTDVKIRIISKDSLKQGKYFACNQFSEKKTKSGAYEVISRVETEGGCVTSTIEMICGYKLEQNVGKYKSGILICGLQMRFITKPITTDFFIFKDKYQMQTLCLTRKFQANLQKKYSWFW